MKGKKVPNDHSKLIKPGLGKTVISSGYSIIETLVLGLQEENYERYVILYFVFRDHHVHVSAVEVRY